MPYFTAPELSDVIVRSRELGKSEQLDPPADWPVVFSCRYHGVEAIGCVYLNGVIVIMPNRFTPGTGPLLVCNWKAVETEGLVTDIVFEWQVTKNVPETGLRLVAQEKTQDGEERVSP
jgi:hypothetical protein